MSDLRDFVEEVCEATGAELYGADERYVVVVPLEDEQRVSAELSVQVEEEEETLVCSCRLSAPEPKEMEPDGLLMLLSRNMDLKMTRIAWDERRRDLMLVSKLPMSHVNTELLVDMLWEVTLEAEQLAEESQEEPE